MPPFPIVRGGCSCGLIRYQIEAAPLFCYACHCVDCQKSSGSVFSANAVIEFDRVRCISATGPEIIVTEDHHHTPTIAACPKCRNALWSTGSYAKSTVNIHVGTLDLPSLMEPDLHTFIEGKIYWVVLPEGAKTQRGHMDRTKVWPKSSLERLEACMKRWEAVQAQVVKDGAEVGEIEKMAETLTLAEKVVEKEDGGEVEKEQGDDVENGQEEKTPTNGSPEPHVKGDGDEDADEDETEGDLDGVTDEEYERRHNEMEKELTDRLEKLTVKLSEYQPKT